MPYEAEASPDLLIAAGGSGQLSILSTSAVLGSVWLPEVRDGTVAAIPITLSGVANLIQWEPFVGPPGAQPWSELLQAKDTVVCTFHISTPSVKKKRGFWGFFGK